jgi:hypothetical protein
LWAEALLDSSKAVGLKINSEKSQYVSHDKTAKQNHNVNEANKSYENVAKFNYLGIMVTKLHS